MKSRPRKGRTLIKHHHMIHTEKNEKEHYNYTSSYNIHTIYTPNTLYTLFTLYTHYIYTI